MEFLLRIHWWKWCVFDWNRSWISERSIYLQWQMVM